jgi:predicted enzyme related to lactoylglutathione lyase
MSRVTHFEIHASKPQELMNFYTELLGWKFNKWGAIDYWLIETGPSDEPGVNGGKQYGQRSSRSVTALIAAFREQRCYASLP